MINCYFSDRAYYIVGKELEIYSSLVVAQEDQIHQTYWAFLMLLPELATTKDNVTFFNDTRLIDDMNGVAAPLDQWTKEAKRMAGQMLSSLYGIVLFRKLDKIKLDKVLANASEAMIDPKKKNDLATKVVEDFAIKHSSRVQRLRDSFFGESNGK